MMFFVAEAHAADALRDVQLAEIDELRGEVADQVHLTAFDLLDELVYGWTNEPLFESPTPVVLAGVTVPVGLGTGLSSRLEDHLVSVLTQNPTTNLQLVHCPACTAVVVHSGPEATVVSRGIDDPAVLAELGTSGKSALFIDIEAEGTWLVLRARVTRLTPDLPIVWSHTIASSSSVPALLRQPGALKSAAEARQEYLDALRGRGRVFIPARVSIRSYKGPGDDGGVPPPPFLWFESGVELSPTDARAWTSSLLVGYSFIPQAYQGLMGHVRIDRLVTGRTRSLTHPDLYAFFGGSVITVWGPATASFQDRILNADQLLAGAAGEGPRTSFGALQVGLDLRVGNRIGVSAFLETIPDLANSQNLGDYARVFGIGFQSLGTEVTFWF